MTSATSAAAAAKLKADRPPRPSLLAELAAALASRRIRVVDLTQTLTPDFPRSRCRPRSAMLAVPDRGGLALRRARPGLVLEQLLLRRAHRHALRRADHWISGKDLANNSIDTIPAQHFVAPACVIDCSAQVAADPDYLLTVDDIEAFESATAGFRRARGS